MTGFWLALGKLFKWSFHFFDFAGNVLNWILFFIACGFFVYWCVQLVVTFGNDRDKDYHSPTENDNPYYRDDLYKP